MARPTPQRTQLTRPPRCLLPRTFTRRRAGYTLTDLMAVMLLVLLALAAILPAAERAREGDLRIKCASNLRMIGLAMMMYANENKGHYPRTQFDAQNAGTVRAFTNWEAENSFPPPEPQPGAGPAEEEAKPEAEAEAGGDEKAVKAPEANDVTAAFYLVIKTQEIWADVFVCPESKAKPMTFAEVLDGQPKPKGKPLAKSQRTVSNFPGLQYLSYSYQNPYPSKEARNAGFKFNNALLSDFALAADLNPGGKAVATVKADAGPDQLKAANSPNHGRAGQNVLYADGHVEFQKTPFCGAQRPPGKERDNIYARYLPEGGEAAGDPGDPVVGPSMDPFDNVLLPTAADHAAGAKGDGGEKKGDKPAPKPPKRGSN